MNIYPPIPSGSVAQQHLDDAGIPANVIPDISGDCFIVMSNSASADDFNAAVALSESLIEPIGLPEISDEKLAASNKWITLKAMLDAVPPPESGDVDPYREIRVRLDVELMNARAEADAAGGLG